MQPFGPVPVYEEDGRVLFESGAIVLHVAARSEVLLPADPIARARAALWVFAALNTLDVVVQELASIDLFAADQEWAKLRRPEVERNVQRRLAELSNALGSRDFLERTFSAGDLMLTTVLRILRHTSLVDADPRLKAYQVRCESRPAFQRALRDQMAPFASAGTRRQPALPRSSRSAPVASSARIAAAGSIEFTLLTDSPQ